MMVDNRDALREAILEAARQGMRGGARRRRDNRNPQYQKPTPAAAAWSHLYGTSRALAEWASSENIALALQGMGERQDDQSANISAIRRAADMLNQIASRLDV